MKNEKRERQRVAFVTRATLEIDDLVTEYPTVKDLSMNGFFLETSSLYPVGANGRIILSLECGDEKKIVSAECEIVRVKQPETTNDAAGMALKILNIDPDSSITLYNMIKYQNRE